MKQIESQNQHKMDFIQHNLKDTGIRMEKIKQELEMKKDSIKNQNRSL